MSSKRLSDDWLKNRLLTHKSRAWRSALVTHMALSVCHPCWKNSRLLLTLLAIASVTSILWYIYSLPSASLDPTIQQRIDCARQQNGRQQIGWMDPFGLPPSGDSAAEAYEPLFSTKLVHLDLKGAPPKLSYLASVLPLMAKLGATGLLIEYEDMFPYSGQLASLSATNAYTVDEIVKMNALAKENRMEVIPLVQTFGHLEFVLKYAQHVHLREVPEQPQAICPSHNETQPLLRAMLQQVAKLHPDSKRIHIGADEVYFIGRCDACQSRLSRQMLTNSDLFIQHVSSVVNYVNDRLHLRPMMWDDEFRSFSERQLFDSGLGRLVDIVVWNYHPQLELGPDVWNKYLNVFDSLWVASAFKGATGPDKQVPDIAYHLENHRSWMNLVASYKDTVHFAKFKGIMLTGWQRYDHFAVLCELLPASMPSLAANLLLLQHGNGQRRTIDQEGGRILGCPAGLFGRCDFSGASILNTVQHLGSLLEQETKMMNTSVVKGWLTGYNIARGFSSPAHLERISVEVSYLRSSAQALQREARSALDEVYDPSVTSEWIATHLQPLVDRLNVLSRNVDEMRSKTVWPRRPLPADN